MVEEVLPKVHYETFQFYCIVQTVAKLLNNFKLLLQITHPVRDLVRAIVLFLKTMFNQNVLVGLLSVKKY